jgi:hypothetical protein
MCCFYFVYVICIYFQQHDVRVVKQQETDVTSGAGTAYLYRASGFIKFEDIKRLIRSCK